MDYSWVLESESEYDVLGNKHDKGYRYILSVKRVFLQLIRSFVNQGWVNEIDENKTEKIDRSFILEDFKGKELDLIYKVRVGRKDIFLYLLMELQSTVDYQMPYRLLQYMLEIWRAILKDTDKKVARRKSFKLPAIIPCVLYNGRYNWTAETSFRQILEKNDMFGKYALDFEYILFDVARYSEDELLRLGNLIGAIFYIDQETKYENIIRKLKNLVDLLKEFDEKDYQLFKVWLKNIFMRGIPKEKAREIGKIIDSGKEVDTMVYAMEIALRDKIKEVELKGRTEGKIEGKMEGKLVAAKNLINMGMKIENISIATEMPIKELKQLLKIE